MARSSIVSLKTILLCLVGPLLIQAVQPPGKLFSPLVGKKVFTTATTSPDSDTRYPQYTNREGTWQYFTADQWTSGFFPATLYQLHERKSLCSNLSSFDRETDWLGLGRQWGSGILPLLNRNHFEHDVGFISFPFRDELNVNPENSTAINVIQTFANQLAGRFNPVVGCTRSWDTADPTDFQVIIDNMMNLDLLFLAANLTGNNTYREIAISHADKTIENHIRADGSSFHVVEYNSTTGNVIRRRTAQGFADYSTWTRGQAWGLYGFATMYTNTGEQRYLDASRRMATFFKNSMPSDGIVPWDFNAPIVPPPRPADSSAATIAATGLLLLSRIEASLRNPNAAHIWRDFALSLLDRITKLSWKPDWQSLLANGTVNVNADPPNQLTGIVYGDYYFVKAGNDLVSMGLASC